MWKGLPWSLMRRYIAGYGITSVRKVLCTRTFDENHSWERGANENTNGLIRQYIPKGTDFSEITDEFVSRVENKLNNRPRKRLGYLTPNEKFNSILTN